MPSRSASLTQSSGMRRTMMTGESGFRARKGTWLTAQKYTIQFNSARIDTLPQSYWDKSWGVYQDPMRFAIVIGFWAKPSASHVCFRHEYLDDKCILSLQAVTVSSSTFRMLAPVGYVWVPHVTEGWRGYVPNVTCEFCELIVTPQVRLF